MSIYTLKNCCVPRLNVTPQPTSSLSATVLSNLSNTGLFSAKKGQWPDQGQLTDPKAASWLMAKKSDKKSPQQDTAPGDNEHKPWKAIS